MTTTGKSASQSLIEKEHLYSAHNYHPLPVVLQRGEGVHVWDVEGKKYFDFLSGYSAVNQGHCHPVIVNALVEQAKQLTLVSRAFYSDALGAFAAYLTSLFGFDKMLPVNTGVEAVETALKLARHWGYRVKGIRDNEARIIVCKNNFHGRTISVVSFSSDGSARNDFGPFTPGFIAVEYNNLDVLKNVLKDENIAGFLIEPIQGEAGVLIPDEGYLTEAARLCKEANVLFIADEIQTGLGRTGKMLACDHEGVKPDILILGKALSGGIMPVSAVLADDEIMMTIQPGEHGSTYGGNPLACKVAMAALKVIVDEGMVENAAQQGELLRAGLRQLHHPYIADVRGKGLMNAITIQHQNKNAAWDLCLKMRDNGLLAKPTHGDKIRFTPPLLITEDQVLECVAIIGKSLSQL